MLLQISPPFSRSYTVKQGLTIVALDLITSLRAFRLFAVFTRSAFSSPQPNKPSDTLYSEDVGPLYRGRERSRRVCRPSAAAEGGRHAATGRDGQDVHQRVRETGGHARVPEMPSVSPWSFSGRFSRMGAEEGSLAQSSANMVAGANRASVWTLGAAGYAMSTAEQDCSSLGPRRDCSIEQRRNQLPSSTLSRRTSITPLRIEDEQTETRLTLSYFTRHSDSAYPARSSAASNALLPTVSWLLSRHD